MQFLSISQRRKGFAEDDYASLAEQETERARELYSEGSHIWGSSGFPVALSAVLLSVGCWHYRLASRPKANHYQYEFRGSTMNRESRSQP
jgi:hypothetical protein